MTDPTDLMAIALADAEAQERAARAAETAAADLVWIMGDERGRRFVWGILEAAGVYRLSYAHGADACDTAFREGGRNLGLGLLARLNENCPESFSLMTAEARTKWQQ